MILPAGHPFVPWIRGATIFDDDFIPKILSNMLVGVVTKPKTKNTPIKETLVDR